MMTSDNFEKRVRQVQSGWKKRPPDALIRNWQSLVEACEEGYDDNASEYRFDLQVRDSIAEVLADEQLATMPEMESFREQVESLDRRLKAVLRAEPVYSPEEYPWWLAYPLSYGGEEIAEEYYFGYGIRIDIIP